MLFFIMVLFREIWLLLFMMILLLWWIDMMVVKGEIFILWG